MPIIPRQIEIPLTELELTYSRSSGPGGQNVNKVNSKAQLRWNIPSSLSLHPDVKVRLLEKFSGRLTTEGDLLIASDRYRDQIRNREDCLVKLFALVNDALKVAIPRKETSPTVSSKRKKRENKSHNSNKKALRKPPGTDH